MHDPSTRRPALFLDRDGTIIEDVGYISSPDDVHLIDGSAGGMRAAAEAGYALVVVSNQSGVGRGLVTEASVACVDLRMRELLTAQSVAVDGSYYCPHGPDDGCRCRKPLPGLLLDAAEALDLDLANSWMVGDRDSDLEAGTAAGCAGTIAFRFEPTVPVSGRAESWPEVLELMGVDRA